MQRRHRLTGDSRIGEVHRTGRSVANDLLVMRLLPNGMDRSRFCIVAGKRVGNAVVRNQTKRRMREAVRNCPTAPGWDAIVIARRGAGGADFTQIRRATHNLFRRTELGRPDPNARTTAVTEPGIVHLEHAP
jgi:ribonuclease P protein component